MGKYIKDVDWDQYEDFTEEYVDNIYNTIEQKDKERSRKQIHKMREDFGYYEDE